MQTGRLLSLLKQEEGTFWRSEKVGSSLRYFPLFPEHGKGQGKGEKVTEEEASPRSRRIRFPLHPMLAQFMLAWKKATPYSEPSDWVFASFRCKGKQPRVANMLVEDHLKPAAVNAGGLTENDPGRFGFHNLRHSLASFLVRSKTDPKTVQALLRHSLNGTKGFELLKVKARSIPIQETIAVYA